MIQTENKTTTEVKEKEIPEWTTQELCDLAEWTQGAIISIKAILQKFKDDHYEKQENPDELDQLLEEVQDSIDGIGDLI